MKKILALSIMLICVLFTVTGCSDNNNPSQNTDVETPTVEEEILPTDIKINLYNSSVWEVSNDVYISVTISPSNTTNKDFKWSFSNPGVAYINGHTLTPGKAGVTSITATTSNGLSDTIEFEVKSFCERELDLPKVVTKGTSSYLRRYEITDVNFTWYYYTSEDNYGEYAERIKFEVQGSKIYDMSGSDNTTSDRIARLNLYDKDGYQVATSTIYVSGLLLNDKFKEDVIFNNVPLSGAPYSVKLVDY